MSTNQLVSVAVHPRSSLRPQLALLASFSFLPLLTLSRLRWNSWVLSFINNPCIHQLTPIVPSNSARFGLDPLHLILIQLLFTLFVYQKSTAPSSGSELSTTKNQLDTKLGRDRQERKGARRASNDTPVAVAESLKELIEKPVDWVNVFPTPGLEILHHRSINSLYAVRTEIEDGTVTLEQLVRCIQESKQWEWDKMCECGEDLGDGVTWLRLKGFWPIKPKELIVRSGIFQLPPAESGSSNRKDSPPPIRILAATSSTTHPLKKSTLEIKFAGYVIEQIPSCGSGFQVTQIVDLSGFGPLPTFVTKAILRKFIPSSLRKLITLAHRIEPLPTSPEQNGSPPSWMPPPISITSSSSKSGSSNNQESLRPIVEELKKMVHDLQRQNKSSSRYLSLASDSTRRLKFISLLGSASLVTFCLSFILFKHSLNHPAFFKRFRDKVR